MSNEITTAPPRRNEFGLHCSTNGGWNYFTVVFEGPDQVIDTAVVNYLARKPYLVVDVADDQAETLARLPLTRAALWPTCEHSMSAKLCWGPDHFPSREQEMAWEVG